MDSTFFSTPEEIYSQNSVSVEGIHPQTVPNPLIESEGLGFGHQTYAISPVPSVLHPFTPWHSQRENFSNLVDFQEPDNRCKSVQIMTPAAYYADKFERYVYDNHSIDQNQFLERYIAKWETSTRFPEIKNPGFQWFSPIESLGGSNMRLLSSSSMDFPYSNVSKQSNNELSLSLATTRINVNSDQYSDAKLGSDQASYSSKDHSKIGPAADFSKQIFGSMYLKAVQEILAQIASYSLENLDIGAGMTSGVSWFRNSEDEFSAFDNGRFETETQTAVNRLEVESKKSQLLSLLQAVDDQYNHCLDEIHTVVSAFHAATEIDPQLHARFALKTVSFHYKNLRERLSSRILELGSVLEAAGDERGKEKAMEVSFVQQHLAFQQLTSKRHNQLWRPQRGLPEKSVSVLRAWMFQNFLHPYPKDAEKHLLAVKSGLSRNQVSNWFINARVRLWKPMIEEMYTELNRRKAQQDEEGNEGGSTRNAGISSTISHQRFKMIQDELKP